jgi:hypothetical protein
MAIPSIDDVRSKASAIAFGKPLVQNNLRGLVAEVIVGYALEPDWEWCSGDWLGWDFEHADGTRLEIKQSAARQTWTAPDKPRTPAFDIRARSGYYLGAEWRAGNGRNAHIYLFAYHFVANTSADHRDPQQWLFYVVPADCLPAAKTIGLAKVASLSSAKPWGELLEAVEVRQLERITKAI